MSRFATLKVRSPWFHKNVPFDNRFSLNFVYCLNIAEKINEIELKRILRSFWRYTWGLRILRTTWGLSIIATFIRDGRVEERPRGGPNNVKVDKEMRQCLNEIIDENCLLTLAQTNQELRRRLPAKPFIYDRISFIATVPMSYRSGSIMLHGFWIMWGHQPLHFHRRMWLQYMDSQRLWSGKSWRSSISPSLWANVEEMLLFA